MNLTQFLAELAACEGHISMHQGVATFESGDSFDVAAAVANAADTGTTLEFADWRVQDGDASEVPASLIAPGKLTVNYGSYGIVMNGVTPDGRAFCIGMEFDAGAPRLLVFPPDTGPEANPTEDTLDTAVVTLTILNDSVVVHSGYGQAAQRYAPDGCISGCPAYDGHAVLANLAALASNPKE